MTPSFEIFSRANTLEQSKGRMAVPDSKVNYLSRVIDQLHIENDLLLTELHRLQEALKAAATVARHGGIAKRIDVSSRPSLQHIVQSDMELLTLNYADSDDQPLIGGCNTATFTIDTRGLKLELPNQDARGGPLFRGHGKGDVPSVSISTHKVKWSSTELSTILGLTASSWSNFKDSLDKIIRDASQYATSAESVKISNFNIPQGLANLSLKFREIPNILRYDSASLNRARNELPYTALSVMLSNVSYGGKTIAEFNFNIATHDERTEDRGNNPRLEFPAISKSLFESWYVETADDQGGRLELRFKHPDMMDTTVWARLSSSDQILIAGIVRSLPDIIFELQTRNPDICFDWPAMYKVAFDCKRILSAITKLMAGSARKLKAKDATE